MSLTVSKYDPEFDTVIIHLGDPHDETDEIDTFNHHVVDYDSATYRPSSLELLGCARQYLELSPDRGYHAEADTLVIGNPPAGAKFEVANGDLVVHWGYAKGDPNPDFYIPITVELRNASKHLAAVVKSLPPSIEAIGT